ncbi:MAG: hypothetical protein ICV84_01835 [Flavisolibacter sp.]|nr:hypothetical protein [Flavisolibacter sp.]
MLKQSTIKTVLFALFMVVLVLGCKKSNEDNNNTIDYSPLTTGSSWTYQSNGGTSYTLTVTGKDTVALARTYKVLNNSSGPNIYRAKSGSDYYQFAVIPGLGINGFELLYLKDNQAVNTSWQNNQVLNVPNVPLPLVATFNYTLKEKGIARTVNTKAYSDVIHIRLDVSVAGIGSLGGGDFYYANKVGMIESSLSLSYSGQVINQTDILTAYTIK